MSWSKVKQPFKKSLRWWYHKILCELAYKFHGSGKGYYRHLNKMCVLGWNLYGDVWPPVKQDFGFDLTADYDKIIAAEDAKKEREWEYKPLDYTHCGLPTLMEQLMQNPALYGYDWEALSREIAENKGFPERFYEHPVLHNSEVESSKWWEDVHVMD